MGEPDPLGRGFLEQAGAQGRLEWLEEGLEVGSAHRGEHVQVGFASEDGGRGQHGDGGLGQRVDAVVQYVGDPGRHVVMECPDAPVGDQQSKFSDEQRITVGPGDEQHHVLGRQGDDAAFADEAGDAVVGQRGEAELPAGACVRRRADGGEFAPRLGGPIGGDGEQRPGSQGGEGEAQQVQGRFVGAVHVVEDEQQRTVGGDAAEVPRERTGEPERVEAGAGHGQPGRHRGRAVGVGVGEGVEDLDPGPPRWRTVHLGAVAAGNLPAVALESAGEQRGQMGLARPGLPGQPRQTRLTAGGASGLVQQDAEFGGADVVGDRRSVPGRTGRTGEDLVLGGP
ncbi:hypothetical protein AIIKEEIJ_04394 [Rhodococcus sp. YH1]|nr:hypothetical protein [Rhodococcus sp. YH1]